MERQIREIADKARKWAERLNRKEGNFTRDLGGMCGIASYELFKRLSEAGLDPTMCFADCHVFVRCGEFTVDVTATQFSHYSRMFYSTEVVKTRRACQLRERFWVATCGKAKTETEILKRFKSWPDYQRHPNLRRRHLRLKGH